MTDITIPPEAVKALELALLGRPLSTRNCTAALRAALKAWPNAMWSPDEVIDGEALPPIVCLPFRHEASNE